VKFCAKVTKIKKETRKKGKKGKKEELLLSRHHYCYPASVPACPDFSLGLAPFKLISY